MSLGYSQHRLTKTFSPIILSSRHQREKKYKTSLHSPPSLFGTSQQPCGFSRTRPPRLFMFMQSLFYLRQNLIGSLLHTEQILSRASSQLLSLVWTLDVYDASVERKVLLWSLKSRDAPAQSDGSFEELEEVTKGRFCIRLIKVTWIIRQHRLAGS